MLLVGFALLSVVGAWMTWRRNPLYSARSAVRSVVVILLAIAALVAVIVATVDFAADKSPVVFGITMGAVIMLGAFSLIFIIQKVTTPKEARLETALPPGTKIVHVHRQKVYIWTKRMAIVVAGLGLLGFLLPGNFGFAAFALGGFTLLLAVFMLSIFYMTSLNFDRALTAMLCHPWVHWQYSAEQWNQWSEIQAQRAAASPPPAFVFKRDWRKLLLPFSIIAGGVLIFGPGSLLYRTSYLVGVCALMAGMWIWAAREDRSIPARMRRNLRKAAPEAYFGHDGVFCDGVFTTWLSMNIYLLSASLDERQPRSLMFVFEEVVTNPYSGNQLVPIHQSVLIPSGAEDDISRLQKELSARCPKARIILTSS